MSRVSWLLSFVLGLALLSAIGGSAAQAATAPSIEPIFGNWCQAKAVPYSYETAEDATVDVVLTDYVTGALVDQYQIELAAPAGQSGIDVTGLGDVTITFSFEGTTIQEVSAAGCRPGPPVLGPVYSISLDCTSRVGTIGAVGDYPDSVYVSVYFVSPEFGETWVITAVADLSGGGQFFDAGVSGYLSTALPFPDETIVLKVQDSYDHETATILAESTPCALPMPEITTVINSVDLDPSCNGMVYVTFDSARPGDVVYAKVADADGFSAQDIGGFTLNGSEVTISFPFDPYMWTGNSTMTASAWVEYPENGQTFSNSLELAIDCPDLVTDDMGGAEELPSDPPAPPDMRSDDPPPPADNSVVDQPATVEAAAVTSGSSQVTALPNTGSGEWIPGDNSRDLNALELVGALAFLAACAGFGLLCDLRQKRRDNSPATPLDSNR